MGCPKYGNPDDWTRFAVSANFFFERKLDTRSCWRKKYFLRLLLPPEFIFFTDRDSLLSETATDDKGRLENDTSGKDRKTTLVRNYDAKTSVDAIN